MDGKRKLLGAYLLEKGVISESQLQQAVEEGKRTNTKIGEVLFSNGIVKEEDLVEALSEQMGIPLIDISLYNPDLECVSLISRDMAERLQAIPVYKIERTLTVAMQDPLDIDAIDEIENLTRLTVVPIFVTPSGFKAAIEKYYLYKEKTSGITASRSKTDISQTGTTVSEKIEDSIKEATQTPVIKLAQEIIMNAVLKKASDIHLEPQEKTFCARYRIDGILQESISLPKEFQSALISRIKIMADIDISERRLPQDGRVKVKVRERDIDLRVATFPTIHGEHVAIRVLDKSEGILDLDVLGLEGGILSDFKNIVHKPYGLVLVTGPTGSGKTTTLYSSLKMINSTQKNIITLDDPVEYSLPNIHQSQVNVKAGLTFATGLRSIVRLDPDIIMIGEIRDKETAEIAIHAALTGHLVFSTLHTNDASSACARLVNIGVEPYLLASSLSAVLAQRLIRKLCDHCKESYPPMKEELSIMDSVGIEVQEGAVFYKEKGCSECQDSGFKGRTGIYELLLPTTRVKELIIKKASAHEITAELKSYNMRFLINGGLGKVKAGITSISEVLRVIQEV